MLKALSMLLLVALLLMPIAAFSEGTGEDVSLFAMNYDARQQEFKQFFDKFTEKYPNIKVEMTTSDADYQANLVAMIASNSMPDIVAGEYRGLYDYGSAGHLYNLIDQPFIQYYPEEIRQQMTAPDGAIYGIPNNMAAMGIYWNQEMFQQAGIEKFPETITEMKTACEKLTSAGFVPFSVAGSEAWTLGQMFFVELASVHPDVMAFSTIVGTDQADLLLDKVKYGLQALDLQFDNAISTSPTNDYGTFLNDFATGKVAMIQMGTWVQSLLESFNPQFTMRYAAVPFTEDPNDVRLSANIGVSYAISTQTEYFDECLKVFDYIASDEGQDLFGKLFGEIPISVNTDFVYSPAMQDVKNYLDAGKVCPWSQVLMTEAGRGEGSNIMQSYYFDQISADEAIMGVYDNWMR